MIDDGKMVLAKLIKGKLAKLIFHLFADFIDVEIYFRRNVSVLFVLGTMGKQIYFQCFE